MLRDALLALLALGCLAQQDDSVFVGLDSNGELLLRDGSVSTTLRSLTAQLSALQAEQAALVAEACMQGRLSVFQTIPTAGARDMDFFAIGGVSYLAVANRLNVSNNAANSLILRFDASSTGAGAGGGSFVHFQTIPTLGARDWEHFTISNQSFLAVANLQDRSGSFSVNSEIFRFDGSTFVHFQSLPTIGANDFKFFTIGNQSYLAVASYLAIDGTLSMESPIFRFNGSRFVFFQSVRTQAAWAWEFFTIGHESYLAVANHQETNTDPTTNSSLFRFNGTRFVPFQAILTQGARDWEFFTIDGQSYLAVANFFNSTSYSVNSQIFRWSGSSFVPFQSILTHGAHDWDFFSVNNGQSYYLAVANSVQATSVGVDNFSINSQIFRWSGSSFVSFQSVATQGAAHWEFFSVGGHSYLAVANERNATSWSVNSQIFRLRSPCFS
jgi:hypothetical protein